MPPLCRPNEQRVIMLPAREALFGGRADVLVIGGGPAGIGASMGAAFAGARVILAERHGFLGGNATAALVMPLMSFHTHSPTSVKTARNKLMPADHGPGRPVIAGILKMFIERLVRGGGAIDPSYETGYVVPFDPEIFKLTAMELLDEAGVEYLLHSFATGILGDTPNPGVVLETKSGPVVIFAKVVVDCTGDGDIAARFGAAFEIGREEDGLVQPMTLMFRMIEFQNKAFYRYVREHPDQWNGVQGLRDLIGKAREKSDLNLAREDVLFFGTPHAREVAVNSTRVVRVLGTNVWDLTYAECEGRRQMRQIAAFLRRYVPGFEKSYVVQSGVAIGIRETRRIIGQYQLTSEDLLNARKFDDVIACGTYPIDIHSPTGKGTTLRRLPPGDFYEIPLRALIPRDVDRLIVAGRCISGTHEAHSSYRIMPISMATGHAAGACAALAAGRGITPRDVHFRDVQAELLRQGAHLG
jgi:hypothetical protein